jgi:LPXTG-motif cell wall-anchored protein
MSSQKDTTKQSLFASLAIVGLFIISILLIQSPQAGNVNQFDRVMAGAPEPTDIVTSAPPIGGAPEPTNTSPTPTRSPLPTKTPIPTKTPATIATVSPTATPTVTPLEEATLPPIVNTTATPVPTFQVDFPGEVTNNPTTPTPAPVVKKTNSTPLIIGVVAGTLLLVGGILLFVFRRQNDDGGHLPPMQPPQNPPFTQYPTPPTTGGFPPETPIYPPQDGTNTYTTPYDQYVNNTPNDPNAPKNS